MSIETYEFTHAVAAKFEEYVLRGGICMTALVPLSVFTLVSCLRNY